MPTTNQVKPAELVRPMVDGIIAMAMVSAMTSMMAMATSATVSAAGISTMGSFIPYTGGRKEQGGFSTGKQKQPTRRVFSNPHEELESLNKRIRSLSYKLEIQREAVRGTRIHKAKLMQEYKLGVLPSIVEMGKYPKLRMTDFYLNKAEKDLDRMEISMLNLRRRRKELQVKLGLRVEEGEEVRRVYPAMKKFKPPPGLGD